jgi:hypothetical protein
MGEMVGEGVLVAGTVTEGVALGEFEDDAPPVQDDAPAALDAPAAQLKHEALDELPVLGLKVPAAQLEHDDAPPVLYVPAKQG